MINIYMSVFYKHRGLIDSEIIWLAVIFAITNVSSEILSSCSADTYGRKRILVLGVLCYLGYWVVYLQADSFFLFCIGTLSYAASCALFSGTDQALLYDSIKEFYTKDQVEQKYKKYIGWFYAASRYSKIMSPILSVLLVKTAKESNFFYLFYIDIAASIFALILVCRLVEAGRTANNKISGTFRELVAGAVSVVTGDSGLKKIALEKSLLMSSSFAVLSYYTDFFHRDLGVDMFSFSILWSFHHGAVAWFSIYVSPKIRQRVRWVNRVYLKILLLLIGFIALWFMRVEGDVVFAYVLYVVFVTIFILKGFLLPLYSAMVQEKAASYNRATVISVTDMLKGVTDVLVIGTSALLVEFGKIYPYFVFMFCMLVIVLFLARGQWRD